MEAPEGFGNDLIEKIHKKTNTPKIPSMIVLPSPLDDPKIESLPKLSNVRVVQVMSCTLWEKGCVTKFLNSFFKLFITFQYLPGQGDHALFTPPSSTSGKGILSILKWLMSWGPPKTR